tara:strand:+ start:1884 stop:2771 length:888 start_codon:yes stop_codon:yes gene_type:complete
MKSNYKRSIVFDLETGGFSEKYNNMTEIAMVAIDMETLDIIEEFSILIKPRLDLTNREDDIDKEAKSLFKMLKLKDEDTGKNILKFKGEHITLKNLDLLECELESFYLYLDTKGIDVIEYDHLIELEKDPTYSDIVKIYFDRCYNPQALEATHMPRELFEKEGVEYDLAFCKIKEFIESHKVGNSKPIIAGHNIKKFDNPFMEVLFSNNGEDFYKHINDTQMFDTLEWARLKWFEMPSYALGVIANELGITLKEAHRALPDTIANAKVLIKMLKHLRGEGESKSSYTRKKYNFNF